MLLLSHFAGLLQDVVIGGPDRDYIVALFFPAVGACRQLCTELPPNAAVSDVLAQPAVREAFQQRLNSFAATYSGNSTQIVRAILMETPPSVEALEITDKGTINQRAVLNNRAEEVDQLYQDPPPAGVLTIPETIS